MASESHRGTLSIRDGNSFSLYTGDTNCVTDPPICTHRAGLKRYQTLSGFDIFMLCQLGAKCLPLSMRTTR